MTFDPEDQDLEVRLELMSQDIAAAERDLNKAHERIDDMQRQFLKLLEGLDSLVQTVGKVVDMTQSHDQMIYADVLLKENDDKD